MALDAASIQPTTVSGINKLPEYEKREICSHIIPIELLEHFHLSPFLVDIYGNDLLKLSSNESGTDMEIELRHQYMAPDPVLYGHITDTLTGHLHILLYTINDPDSPRYNVDRMPDGTPTNLGADCRNIEAEIAAMEAGLAPGQIRRGLRMLANSALTFEQFVHGLGHDLYFAEHLYYHNAVIFERYGFSYAKGRKLMEQIETGFAPGGNLIATLDCSTPFRRPEAFNSIRMRSWAIHDGILGQPFNDVTMYKQVGKHAGVNTSPDCGW
jgi:hypothetical protein